VQSSEAVWIEAKSFEVVKIVAKSFEVVRIRVKIFVKVASISFAFATGNSIMASTLALVINNPVKDYTSPPFLVAHASTSPIALAAVDVQVTT
jgi:hypothetical protein